MSGKSGSQRGRSQKKEKKVGIRLMIRLSHSGRRIPVNDDTLDPRRACIRDVLGRIGSELPSGLLDDGGSDSGSDISMFDSCTVVHMRASVARPQWARTTLSDIGVEGGTSALLTLNLQQGQSSSAASANSSGGGAVAASAPLAASETSADANADATADATAPSKSDKKLPSPGQCLEHLMSNHFDADSKECVLTLLKMINAVLTKPGDRRVRCVNVGNPNFAKRVGDKAGGVDFLLATGFTEARVGGAAGGLGAGERRLELLPENESLSRLKRARLDLHLAAKRLGVVESDLPNIVIPERPPTTTTTREGGAGGNGGNGGATFDPYKGHLFNTQAAAVGANAFGVSPDGEAYVSAIQRQLNQLNAKAERMEKELQSDPIDRMICALRPGASPPKDESPALQGTAGSSDAALIAGKAKRMEEQRKKQSGFQTKAMRDLDRMKKAKVYAHTLLKICFPDGYSLSARFYPSERISHVRDVVLGSLTEESKKSPFDLYVAPPRRLLDESRTLADEQLVPAAKVHVSWKVGTSPGGGAGSYLRQELFASGQSSGEFPDAKDVAHQASSSSGRTSGGSAGGKPGMDEDELMRRMLGQPSKGLKSARKSDKKGSAAGGGGKPKWFKG